MFTPKRRPWLALFATLVLIALFAGVSNSQPSSYGIGHAPAPADVKSWNVDVSPRGENLPPGSGSVDEGEQIYHTTCAACHGASGEGGPMDRLVGGKGTLGSDKPVKTIGSYWPYATTVFDYVRRAMPFNKPGTLSDRQVYAVTAYLLYLNGIVPKDAVMNAATLPRVAMPNQANFIQRDPRPDVP